LDLLSEFLKEIDPVTSKSIYLFWAFSENETIIDEHRSYQLMSKIEINTPLWFIGFKHLSGIQIDMLKDLGEKCEVSIFFPKDVYVETVSTDWIRWLIPEAKTEQETTDKKLKIVYFPKNKLNVVLDSLGNRDAHFDLALASSRLSLGARQEVMIKDQFFKSPEDLFKNKREVLIDELDQELGEESVSIQKIIEQIEAKKIIALNKQDFIFYKLLLLFQDALTFYAEFQTSFDSFALKVFKMILELNSPRVSMVTLSQHYKTRLFEISELPYKESHNPLIVIASSNYGILKTGESKYSEKMMEALKVIAPIKRAGLDFSYLKSELIHTLNHPQNILLMEEGLDLIDLSWREVLKSFELEILTPDAQYFLKDKKDFLSVKIKHGPHKAKHVSASSLQSFTDCPRKYYFSYVDRLDHRPEERLKIAADEMGMLEHKIIEHYFKNLNIEELEEVDLLKIEKLCHQFLNEFILKNKIALSEKVKVSTYYELLHFSQNGIEFLVSYIKENSARSIEFERSIGDNPWGLVGSIDCLVHLPENQVSLFDFKRSGASIGSKKETLLFEKVQIWIYLIIVMRVQQQNISSWGYLNLSEIESSQLYHEKELTVIGTHTLDDFQNIMEETITKLNEEIQFKAHPRNNKICNFCEVQLFCSKERGQG
jgi:CRISPR/Cas system-associated exonuclease Cas4 (RecB family)